MNTKSNRTRRAVAFLVIAILIMTVFPATLYSAPKKPVAKNLIVMISDGWAYNHLDAVSYYEYGKDARQVYAHFPTSLAMSTYMAYYEGDPCYDVGYDPLMAWSDFGYVATCYTDSAAAATTMASGMTVGEANPKKIKKPIRMIAPIQRRLKMRTRRESPVMVMKPSGG